MSELGGKQFFHSINREGRELAGWLSWNTGELCVHDLTFSVCFDCEWFLTPATSDEIKQEFIRDYLAQRNPWADFRYECRRDDDEGRIE